MAKKLLGKQDGIKLIIVKFTSGLGNQMFQYSLYSYLREQFPGVKVKADTTWFARSAEHQGYELERLFKRADNPDFVLERASHLEILRLCGRYPNVHTGFVGELWQNILKLPHALIRARSKRKYEEMRIEQSGFEDNETVYKKIRNIDPAKNWYISGFFIEEVYYRDRLDKLRSYFRFDDFGDDKNREYAKQIKECNSVSIHVRRGDYLSKQYSGSFIALSMDYYRDAVKKVLSDMEDAKFFIFSDDKEFIETAFDFIDKDRRVIVAGNTGRDSFRDMQLMSMCKRNITANSTFSVWAGLLNANEGARVYYPKAYMHEKDSEIKTIPGWERV